MDSTAISDWIAASGDPSGAFAIIVSSQLSVGPSRFLYTMTDPGYQIVAAPDTPSRLRLFALDRSAEDVFVEVEGTFLDTGTGRGLYRAVVEFPCFGMWGAEILARPADADELVARAAFRVTDIGATPAVGAPAPRSQNLTATTMDEVRRISTDPEPQLEAFQQTIEQAVTSGSPSVVFFATPAFCQSGVCGPTVDMVKTVMAGYRDAVEFVMVEPYRLEAGVNGLQPALDAEGRLQTVEAVDDYGIAVEPYLFVVDADGNVAAKFEVVVDEDELRGALEDVTS